MTATVEPGQRGPRPDRGDIDRAIGRLVDLPHYRDRYPFTCGALGHIVQSLADLHARCRKPHCDTCTYLRRGLAYIAALDEGETQ